MGLDIAWFRQSMMVMLGLGGCGPRVDSATGEGDAEASTALDTGGTSTSMTGSEGTGSTTTPPTWPEPPWCDVAPPPDA